MLNLDEIMEAVENDEMQGFCIKCGEEHGPVEPDARRYPCDCGCGNTVFGAEEILLMAVA